MEKTNNYEETNHKIRKLWESVKELLALEQEILKRIEILEGDLASARKRIS